MAKRVMTLYFEDTSIRLLVASGRQVERWASVPLEPGLVSGGAIIDANKVADKVRELFTAMTHAKSHTSGGKGNKKSLANLFGGGKGKIIVGLSGRDSLYRVLSLPVMADALLGEAVRHEAARALPVPLDELYLSYQRIPGFSNEARVFVAAFPKKTTDTLLRTLSQAGITPRLLDLAPLALCLSVNEPRAIIVDARQDNLNIMVMAGRVPQVIRSLALQSGEKTISENMPTIIEEVNRTVAFYNSSHQQEPLDTTVPVFVSGDLAGAPDSWKALVGRLNAPVAVLPSVIQYPADFPASEFAVNLGLATKELNLEKESANYSLVNLNAMPAALLPKQVNPMRVLIPVVAVVGLAGIVFLWLNLQNSITNTESVESQLTATQKLIIGNAKDVATLTEQNRLMQAQIQPVKDLAEALNAKLNGLETARFLTDSDLQQIIALKPQSVAMSRVMHSAKDIVVSGSTERYDVILNYAEELRNTSHFTVVVSSIRYSSEVNDGVQVITYDFTFQMK
jgi:type IV pilus assembly protein PilM